MTEEDAAMADAEALKRKIRVCMFDQYGTVVDMQTGLWEAAVDYLKGKGWKGNAYEFVTWWRRTHFENSMIDALLHREHTPYREIGHLSVRHVLTRARIEHTEEEVRWLVSCIERLKCFSEVPEALARLQTKYKIVALSNGDPDMLEEAKKHHGIPFDAVISVAEANAFKPHRATYEMAARRHARGFHRPAQAPLREVAPPARPAAAQHDGSRRCHGLTLTPRPRRRWPGCASST
jgi:2-haloacid dehalogenase